jgi:AraC-like DNA-binding protein
MSNIHNINWLINPDSNELSKIGFEANKTKVSFPYPEKIASGFTEHLQLFDGIVLIQDTHKFKNITNPSTISLGKFSTEFESSMFIVNIVHSGMIEISSQSESRNILREPGIDLFGRMHGYEVKQTVHTKENILATTLIIPEIVIEKYLGDEESKILYKNLGLHSQNTLNLLAVPSVISNPLIHCISNNLQNKMQVLYAQSQIIQYLIDLNIQTSSSGIFIKQNSTKTFSVKDLHHLLENSQAETFSLTELGKEFGISPGKLNTLFTETYGESIYSFISNLRLSQAYRALTLTDVPMKAIAHRIGYSHVNHFIYAFKKKYGITPGLLRKESKDF